ncbi:hypothetical protein GF352_00270 [archaeon]|nr:hypothetical protein [archaeon]
MTELTGSKLFKFYKKSLVPAFAVQRFEPFYDPTRGEKPPRQKNALINFPNINKLHPDIKKAGSFFDLINNNEVVDEDSFKEKTPYYQSLDNFLFNDEAVNEIVKKSVMDYELSLLKKYWHLCLRHERREQLENKIVKSYKSRESTSRMVKSIRQAGSDKSLKDFIDQPFINDKDELLTSIGFAILDDRGYNNNQIMRELISLLDYNKTTKSLVKSLLQYDKGIIDVVVPAVSRFYDNERDLIKLKTISPSPRIRNAVFKEAFKRKDKEVLGLFYKHKNHYPLSNRRKKQIEKVLNKNEY